jgi:hypothetical protein
MAMLSIVFRSSELGTNWGAATGAGFEELLYGAPRPEASGLLAEADISLSTAV